MKKIILLFPLFLLFVNCKNSTTKNSNTSESAFSFVIVDSYRESSKDSHSYSTTLSLKDGVLNYDYNYSGFPENKKEHKEKDLSHSDINSIKLKMQELSLYQNYEKKFPVNEKVYIVETGMRLTIIADTVKYSLCVNGGRPMDIIIYSGTLQELQTWLNGSNSTPSEPQIVEYSDPEKLKLLWDAHPTLH